MYYLGYTIKGVTMGLLDLLIGDTKKEDEEDKLKKEYIDKGEQENYNFEEEDLEEDDYFYDDDKE
jgi:hypothetical protein